MYYTTEQFDYNPATKVFSQELSSLDVVEVYGVLPSGTTGITITDPKTNVSASFELVHIDYDSTGEEELASHYHPSMASVQANPALAYTKVLIIND